MIYCVERVTHQRLDTQRDRCDLNQLSIFPFSIQTGPSRFDDVCLALCTRTHLAPNTVFLTDKSTGFFLWWETCHPACARESQKECERKRKYVRGRRDHVWWETERACARERRKIRSTCEKQKEKSDRRPVGVRKRNKERKRWQLEKPDVCVR